MAKILLRDTFSPFSEVCFFNSNEKIIFVINNLNLQDKWKQ